MYELIKKEKISKNLTTLMQDGTFYDLYNKLCDTDNLLEMEECSARVFNAMIFACQTVADKDAVKNVTIDLLTQISPGYGGTLFAVGQYSEKEYLKILQKHDAFYRENGHEKMIECLKHGVAVHFTTPKIMQKIEKDGVFRAYNSMFSTEITEKILAAQKYQLEHDETSAQTGMYLSQGFGFSEGVSMSSQTNSFWMNHTPESLTFLFGSKVYTRNKEGAMQHVKDATSTLPNEQREEILEILENIWDNCVGSDKSLGCILIDRDGLEYEKVTYWNEEPPRVVEDRPYKDNTLNSFSSMENSRYTKDIPVYNLSFVNVPSIYQLEMYRKEHPLGPEERLNKYVDSVDNENDPETNAMLAELFADLGEFDSDDDFDEI